MQRSAAKVKAPMKRLVCGLCRDRLVHRMTMLHAGPDTVLICGGAWEALQSWLRESFGREGKNGGTSVSKRREVVREIAEQLEG